MVVVGIATFREIQIHNFESTAQDLGTSVVTALEEEDISDQINALRQIKTDNPDAQAIVDFYLADIYHQNDNTNEAVNTLSDLSSNQEISIIYRDLAELRAIIMSEGSHSYEDLITRLEPLIQTGSPFRTIATELKGYFLVGLAEESSDEGLRQEGFTVLRGIYSDAEASTNLKSRISQFLTIFGEEVEVSN